MEIALGTVHAQEYDGQCIIMPVYADGELFDEAGSTIDTALKGQLRQIIASRPDCRKPGNSTQIFTLGTIPAASIILTALGSRSSLNTEAIRQWAGEAARAAARNKVVSAALLCPVTEKLAPEAIIQAAVEGAHLGTYQFTFYKQDKQDDYLLSKVNIIGYVGDRAAAEAAIERGAAIAAGVNLARDLVNHPSKYMTPCRMAAQAAEIAKDSDVRLTVLEMKDMEKLKMGALIAVAQGSDEPAKLIILEYKGNPNSNEMAAFVGKGITFDSGGISLKPSEGMGDMKDDMAGGAAVIGAMSAIARLKPKANILGVIPCTENMPSGHAFKPGDVITAMSGKTIEIITTDAEGRLVLADAISYARKLGATRLVDLATLTGACVVALGTVASGVMTNQDEWADTVLAGAGRTGEKMWRLPMFDEYKEQIKSPIADIKNSGGRPAGTITAGLFIQEFAENTPWVHIDIAGTVSTEKDAGYQVKGATGVGVRTLVDLAFTLAD